MSKKKKTRPMQVERSKRSAAGGAKQTFGRSRVFKDQTKYDRKKENFDGENSDG